MDLSTWVQFIALNVIIQVSKGLVPATDRTILYAQLFSNYNKKMRPICGADAPIVTQVGIALRQIVDLNEPQQILTVNLWMRLNWFDCQLQWNSSEFGGIDRFVIPSTEVWVPDLTLYDNAGVGIPGIQAGLVEFTSNGFVKLNFPSVLQSLCKVDVTYFPFDTQICELMFGSWAYTGFEIDITNRSGSGDMANFMLNGEWDLLSIRVKRTVVLYNCCPEPFPDVTFFIYLKRKPLFYVVNLLFPCILITAVAVLGFLLPPDSGEKISLEITVLLSIAVFLLIVSESLPPTSETFPFIGVYFCITIMLVSLSTVLSVVVLNVHFKGVHGRRVPRWIRVTFLTYLAKFVFLGHRAASVHPDTPADVHTANYINIMKDNSIRPIANGISHNRPKSKLEDALQELTSTQFSPLVDVLEQQLLELHKLNAAAELKEKEGDMTSEWVKVAMVLDRLFLMIFVFLQISITIGVFIKIGIN